MSETRYLLMSNHLGPSNTVVHPNLTKRVDPLLTVVYIHPRWIVSDIETLKV